MTEYLFTEAGQVVGTPTQLPENWRNVSGLNLLTDAQLAKLGWKPVVDVIPEFDHILQICVRTGWIVQTDKVVADYTVTPKPLGQVKDEARARLAARRWEAEIGGITVNGARIDTSREGQAMLAGANLLATRFPDQIIDWKADGGFVQLPATFLIELSAIVGLHVQSCFTRERELSRAIDDASTPQAVAALPINTGWPGGA